MRMKKTAMKSGSKKTDQNQKKSWVWVATAQLCVHLREWSVCVCLLQTCKLVVFTSYLSYKLSGVSQWQVMVFRGSPASRDKASWTKPCRWIWHVVPVRSNPTGAATQHTGGDMKVVRLKVHNDEDWRCKYENFNWSWNETRILDGFSCDHVCWNFGEDLRIRALLHHAAVNMGIYCHV